MMMFNQCGLLMFTRSILFLLLVNSLPLSLLLESLLSVFGSLELLLLLLVSLSISLSTSGVKSEVIKDQRTIMKHRVCDWLVF